MKRILFLLIGLSILFGCSKKEDVVFTGQGQNVFYAYFEDNADTKTYLGEGNRLLWTADDRISIFNGMTYNREYKFNGNTGDNGGSFTRIDTDFASGEDIDKNYAYYPYSGETSITSAGVISAILPSIQAYAPDSFGLGANPMAAATRSLDDYDLKFRNICGWLKLQLTGTASIKKITLIGGSTDNKLSGASTISFIDGIPEVTMASDASDRVTLDCDTGVQLDAAIPTSFFIAVPPCTLSGGFTVIIEDTENGYMAKSTAKSFTIQRNTISPMKSFEYNAAEEVRSVTIEDTAFNTYLLSNFDTDGDGRITTLEAAQITRIDISSPSEANAQGASGNMNRPDGPASMESGISRAEDERLEARMKSVKARAEYKRAVYEVAQRSENSSTREMDFSPFPALRYLNCNGQSLSSIDVSKNPVLQILSCSRNQLTSLDVSNNPALEILCCEENQLTSLDISNNPALKELYFTVNRFASLDVSKNPALQRLYCMNNQLTSLNVSNNPALEILCCNYNQLTSLDVSNSPALQILQCFCNRLTSLDVCNNLVLEWLCCDGNQLTSLDVSNCLELSWLTCNGNPIHGLDLRKNTKMEHMSVSLVGQLKLGNIPPTQLDLYVVQTNVDNDCIKIIGDNLQSISVYQFSDCEPLYRLDLTEAPNVSYIGGGSLVKEYRCKNLPNISYTSWSNNDLRILVVQSPLIYFGQYASSPYGYWTKYCTQYPIITVEGADGPYVYSPSLHNHTIHLGDTERWDKHLLEYVDFGKGYH